MLHIKSSAQYFDNKNVQNRGKGASPTETSGSFEKKEVGIPLNRGEIHGFLMQVDI
jgi:hypothetical protein